VDPARNIRLFYANAFLTQFLLWAGVWIKYLVDDRGLELRWVLAMDFPFWITIAALQVPMGALADHAGRRRIIALSGALYAVTIIGFGITTSYWMLFIDYLIWAAAIATQTGADEALLYDSLRAAGREQDYERIIGRAHSLGFTAAFVSIILGGVLSNWLSLGTIVVMSAVFPALAILIAILMKEPSRSRAPEDRRYFRDLRAGLSFAWREPRLRYTLLIASVVMTGTFGPVVLIQPFLGEFDVATTWYGWLQAPLRLCSVLAALVAFRIGARLGVARFLIMACSLVIVAYVSLAAVGSAGAFVFFAIPSLVSGAFGPIVSGHVNSMIEGDQRATILSIQQLWFALQVAFFEPTLGFLADGLDLTWAFAFAGAYFLVLMPPLLLLWRRAHGLSGSGPAPALATSGSPAG
jgi:MFS family permease